eukprot:10040969-Lingulodinium_polyedra.AAC.1
MAEVSSDAMVGIVDRVGLRIGAEGPEETESPREDGGAPRASHPASVRKGGWPDVRLRWGDTAGA